MGTKMMLHRYSPVTMDWDETEYVIDQEFLDKYGSIDTIVPVGYVYEPDKGSLDVYLNGQRLSAGGGYAEIDDYHIQLDLGKDEEGNPYELQEGEEIFIKVWKNQYCSRGQSTISGTQFYELQKEIVDARKFRETDKPYKSLDARLDEIQRQLEVVHGGNANVDIKYEYNVRGQIIREVITGDYIIVREFTYYEDEKPTLRGEMKTETVYYTGEEGNLSHQVTKEYSYDPVTRRLLQTAVRGDM